MTGVDPLPIPTPDPTTEPKDMAPLPGPASALEFVVSGEPALWDPLYLLPKDPQHPGGVLLHPAYARAAAANVWRVARGRVAYARLLDRCKLLPAEVASAVPDPVTLPAPARVSPWPDRLAGFGIGAATAAVVLLLVMVAQ